MSRMAERDIMEAGSQVLRPGLAFFPLDDELVVFSQAAQSLVGLNAAAALIVHELREGVPVAALADALASEMKIAAEESAGWISATLEALSVQGLLADGKTLTPQTPPPSAAAESHARRQEKMPALEAFEVKVQARYRLLGTYALIRYGHRAQMRMVDSVIGHLKSEEEATPTLVIDIPGTLWNNGEQLASSIYCDGKPEGQARQLSQLAPLVKSALWVRSVNAHDFLLDLHAGVVGKDGRCILLPAAAGSGKSSLTAALTHGGFGYYSDEVALVERGSFLVAPVPLSVCVKSTGWDLMSRYFPEIADLPTHRRDDGKIVRYVPPRASRVQKDPALVSHIFFPLYQKDEPTRLEPLSRCNALARLMDQCVALRLHLDQDMVRELVRWIAGIDCYALTFSSLEEAVALVKGVVR